MSLPEIIVLITIVGTVGILAGFYLNRLSAWVNDLIDRLTRRR